MPFNELNHFYNKRITDSSKVLEGEYFINKKSYRSYRNEQGKRKANIYYNNFLKNTNIKITYALPDLKTEHYWDFNEYLKRIGFESQIELDDFEQLLFIILCTFDFDHSVNCRLKSFSFKSILSLHSLPVKNKNRQFENLFKYFLFFHSCNEDFISIWKLQENKIFYRKKEIDILRFYKLYFQYINQHKSHFESLHLDHEEQSLFFNNLALFETIFSSFFELILGKHKPQKALPLFDVKEMFDLLHSNPKTFYKNLENAVPFYKLTSWSTSNPQNVSIYYGSQTNTTIEANIISKKRYHKTIKFQAENYIDTYILFFLRKQENIGQLLANIDKEKRLLHLLHIIYAHPFTMYDNNIFKNKIKSKFH